VTGTQSLPTIPGRSSSSRTPQTVRTTSRASDLPESARLQRSVLVITPTKAPRTKTPMVREIRVSRRRPPALEPSETGLIARGSRDQGSSFVRVGIRRIPQEWRNPLPAARSERERPCHRPPRSACRGRHSVPPLLRLATPPTTLKGRVPREARARPSPYHGSHGRVTVWKGFQ
jgi:hypothetical protein